MAQEINIEMVAGEDFERLLTFSSGGTAIDLTDYTFEGRARVSYSSPAAAFSFTLTARAQTGDNVGKVDWTLARATTIALNIRNPEGQVYVYDLERTDPAGKTKKICRGTITIKPEASR